MRVAPLISPLLLSLVLGALPAETLAACGSKKYCTQMTSCAEAYYQFSQCHDSDLDRDNDGIPCENVCGKTLAVMHQRIDATPFTPPASTYVETDQARASADIVPAQKIDARPSPTPSAREPKFTCGEKRTCGQMVSCAEAMFHLKQCGLRRLDGDGDGVPCNSLCR